MGLWQILVGLSKIPELLLKIEEFLDAHKKERERLWMALSIQIEKKLAEANSPEEIDAISKDLHDLLRDH